MMITDTLQQKAQRIRDAAAATEAQAGDALQRQVAVQQLANRMKRSGLAAQLGVSESMVRKWYYGQRAVSDDAWGRLQGLDSHSQPGHDNKPTAVQNG